VLIQPKLFEKTSPRTEIENITLYALGDFQSRGKVLAERRVALDRLLGAFKRACEKFGLESLPDERIVESLEKLGAKVERLAGFVAKHPFRVTIPTVLAENARASLVQSDLNDS